LTPIEFKTLDEIGTIYSGLTGKSKADFSDGNARFVTYVNVFNNLATDVSPRDFVQVRPGERQNRVRYGDVLFTASSETAEEVGMSSAVTVEPPEPLYLNSFCFGFRPSETALDPEFTKHLFRSTAIRRQIIRTANGVTRINISKRRFCGVVIPVPPLEVQREIVKVLDRFTELEAELEAELQARRVQYEYYASAALSSVPAGIEVRLGDVATIVRGASPRPIRAFVTEDEDGIPWIRIGDIAPGGKYITRTAQRITRAGAAKSRSVHAGDFVLSNSMSFGRPYISKITGCIHDGWLAISDYDESFVPDYLYHLLRSAPIQAEFARRAGSGAVQNLNADIVKSVTVPVPPLQEQRQVVKLLDKFETLVNDVSVGLPAELIARRKQYEYYRDRLLTFQEAA
jgi:type I restriction enzyme S subunit